MSLKAENNKRIAKNTLLLYFRMLLTVLVSLYTSRVILNTLGIVDYGIYNVVGGVVSMFNVLSGSLSSAISRFITFELGKKDFNKLRAVFSSSVSIQTILAITIIIIAEVVGVWFINEKMNISADRLRAANWVFHFSILTFAVNLISVPYNAAIIAHEKMSAFAYISILEVTGKLIIAYLIVISPIDKLIFYGLLMFLVAIFVRFAYTFYCKRTFEECVYYFIWDKNLIKEMFGFAGWNFIGSSSAVIRDHGGNILINLFCGPTVNAARGIAMQVNTAITGFVSNFMTALRPQITKSYASKNFDYMMTLIYQGARISFYMLLFLSLPILINTEYILDLWLHSVPEHTICFVQLVLIFTMSESISNPLITATQATGKIRNYQLIVGGLQMFNIPISYILMKKGLSPEVIFIVSIVISQFCLLARLIMLRRMINLSIKKYIKQVYVNIIRVSIISFILPYIISVYLETNLFNIVFISIISILSTLVTIFYIGCNKSERQYIISLIRKIVYKIR